MPDPARPRVWVTGIGAVSPLGPCFETTARALVAEKTGFRPIDFFDVSAQRVQTGGVAALNDQLPVGHQLTTRETDALDRGTRILIQSTAEAISNAAAEGGALGDVPIVIGTSAGAMSLGEDYFRHAQAGTQRRGQFSRVERYQTQRQVSTLGRALRLRGASTVISNACASGANALGHARNLIASGRHQRVLAGGFDALCQLVFAGFDSLQALAPSGIPRPFDAERDGLALGEGGAMFVLETEAAARERGATPIVELAGYGMSLDVHHLTQPHPEGCAAVSSMTAACTDAGVTPDQIAYLNSHGTGTPLNDVAEANAITEWAGEAASGIPVSSTKSATGHLLGGAGALEAAICVMAMKGGWLPASLGVRTPDPAIRFDLVTQVREASIPVALTNSFGFGGSNASLVFKTINQKTCETE